MRHMIRCLPESSVARARVASLVGSVSVVVAACVAHETAAVANEISAVIKAGITLAAEAEFVHVVLLRALVFSKFEAGSMFGGLLECRRLNLNDDVGSWFEKLNPIDQSSSSSPVVRRRCCRSHLFVRVCCLSQVATRIHKMKKYFNFIEKTRCVRRS